MSGMTKERLPWEITVVLGRPGRGEYRTEVTGDSPREPEVVDGHFLRCQLERVDVVSGGYYIETRMVPLADIREVIVVPVSHDGSSSMAMDPLAYSMLMQEYTTSEARYHDERQRVTTSRGNTQSRYKDEVRRLFGRLAGLRCAMVILGMEAPSLPARPEFPGEGKPS